MKKALTIFALILPSAFAHAEVFFYEGTAEVTNKQNAPSAQIGDVYTFQFSYDDTATDTNPETFFGLYPGALQSFTLAAAPGNSGTFDPATLGYSPNEFIAVDDINNPPLVDGVLVSSNATGTIGTVVLEEIDLVLSSSTLTLFTDNGSGQALSEVLSGPIPDDLSLYDISSFIRFEADESGAGLNFLLEAEVTSLQQVPEPTSLALLGLGGLLVARQRR